MISITCRTASLTVPCGISFYETYWHNDYGRPRGHGCLNLTSQAAKWLFRWTIPSVPPDKELIYGYVGTKVEIKV